jgi:hypothetical protein
VIFLRGLKFGVCRFYSCQAAVPHCLCPILVREHSDHRQGFVLFLESTVAVVIPFLFPLPVTPACCVVIPGCFF